MYALQCQIFNPFQNSFGCLVMFLGAFQAAFPAKWTILCGTHQGKVPLFVAYETTIRELQWLLISRSESHAVFAPISPAGKSRRGGTQLAIEGHPAPFRNRNRTPPISQRSCD